MVAEILIGTSGWHYRHWTDRFYPAGTRPGDFLAWYARRLRTVEINTTFYRLPTGEAVAHWRDGSPQGFVFAVKGSRFITHLKKLHDPATSVRRFCERIDLLGAKLGPIVFQLPPRWHADVDRLAAFLAALPKQHRYAFEFRDPTWFQPAIYQLLGEHQAALCLYDLAGQQAPLEVTAGFVYLRLHGPGGRYQGCYGEDALVSWARRMRGWRAQGLSVYCYFDNDEGGYAPADALALARLVTTTDAGPGLPAAETNLFP